MDQNANWRKLSKRANQLFRATTHPAVLRFPVSSKRFARLSP
jgi:hypothetical protein